MSTFEMIKECGFMSEFAEMAGSEEELEMLCDDYDMEMGLD